ncbi:MOSC domain-containing protein [Marinobacter salicampi]|uniref:MOSC domain-containing protein n=1 Tax=Marinobacter salicampi TaxID=435907 RepID=UPI001F5E65B3|nr:MOSC N-terminal beta barrel domain-containing protein [Marinobacter salicampi]
MIHIHSLFIYPVKSLSGIAVESLAIDHMGPVSDRRWMIVDDKGQFVTQRTRPELAMVATALNGRGEVSVSIPDCGSFALKPGNSIRAVTVWRDTVQAVPAESGPSEALSDFLGQPVSLVCHGPDTVRYCDQQWALENRPVAFADGFPFLVVNHASLDELNTRLEKAVDVRRFRPNVVISGAEPWAEDDWTALTVGNLRLDLVKPCSRCILTTVDPDSGKKDPGQQPLRTLGGYRRQLDGVIFGKNATHQGEGPLQLGQTVHTIE